jgi:hypothetical protein
VIRRIHQVGAVVLADVEGVDPDGLGEDSLFDGVADHLVPAGRLPRLVDGHGKEGVEAKFDVVRHEAISAPSELRGTLLLW